MIDEEIRDRLRSLLRPGRQLHQLSADLRAEFLPQGADDCPEAVLALGRALDYDDVSPDNKARLDRWGAFGPMLETTAGVYPPPLAEVTDNELVLWDELLDATDVPVVQARLADLLWERRHGDGPYQYCRRAIDQYVIAAQEQEVPSIVRADYLIRALGLARAVNDTEQIVVVSDLCVAATESALAAQPIEPGVTFHLLEALGRLPAKQRPAAVSELIAGALEVYAHDPWHVTTAADLALALTPAEQQHTRRGLEVTKVEAWATAAAAAEGLVRASHLEKAIALARSYGLTSRAEELRLELQEAGTSKDFQKISAEVQFPRDQVDRFIDGFVASGDWRKSLGALGVYCPLPETRDEAAASVRKLMEEYPLQYLVSKVVLGPFDVPLQYVSTPDEHFETAMHEHDAQGIAIWGLFASDVLNRIGQLPRPSHGELAEFFSRTFVPVDVAERLATALEHYWSGNYEESLFLCLPRLEAAVRELCRRLGLVIYVEPQGSRPGSLKPLGELLSDLAGHFDERRRHYLKQLLVEPRGYNLRNRALHGFVALATASEAALALQVACLLTLIDLTDVSPARAHTSGHEPTPSGTSRHL